MRRLGVALKLSDFIDLRGTINDWFTTATGRFNIYEGAADPIASEIPENQWIVYHNTTTSEVRIWANVGGLAIKTAPLT